MEENFSPTSLVRMRHRSHDYRFLMRCWRELASKARLRMRVLMRVEGLPVYVLESVGLAKDAEGVVYISAGVHGDEVAGVWGLLRWAEANVERLRAGRFLLFPAMNPHGILLNTRVDIFGRDINRLFHDEGDELMVAWRGALAERRFVIGLCLHEDYDGEGCYMYELSRGKQPMGRGILDECASVIPLDGRGSMDGNRAKAGLIWKRKIPDMPGRPEAIVLCEMGTPLTLTFETPSEYGLWDRVMAQKVFISSALRYVGV